MTRCSNAPEVPQVKAKVVQYVPRLRPLSLPPFLPSTIPRPKSHSDSRKAFTGLVPRSPLNTAPHPLGGLGHQQDDEVSIGSSAGGGLALLRRISSKFSTKKKSKGMSIRQSDLSRHYRKSPLSTKPAGTAAIVEVDDCDSHDDNNEASFHSRNAVPEDVFE